MSAPYFAYIAIIGFGLLASALLFRLVTPRAGLLSR